MATYRIGIGSFNLKDGAVGLGTESSGLGNLKVEGTVKTTDLDVTGVSTFYRYAGFAADNINISIGRTTTLIGEHNTIGDIVVGVGETFTVSTGATIDVGTVESVSIGTHFSPPLGVIDDRPEVPVEGTVRFNKDLNLLEFYNGVDWRQFTVYGGSTSGRGLLVGGYWSTALSDIESVQISTLGNAIDFGTMMTAKWDAASSSSSTRGISGGGTTPTYLNEIEYTTIASRGNGVDFGDLNATNMAYSAGCSSSTRGMFNAGYQSSPAPHAYLDDINYVEIATTGNAGDFANLSTSTYAFASYASPTRGFVAGGDTPSKDYLIQVYTISNKANTTNFGELSQARYDLKGCASTTRGIQAGGRTPVYMSTIDYITMASEGNATDFGNLQIAAYRHGSFSSQIRGLWLGGATPSVPLNAINYVNIASTGDAMDFGEIGYLSGTGAPGGYSDCHGGLGGY